jgi:hypothetical protein
MVVAICRGSDISTSMNWPAGFKLTNLAGCMIISARQTGGIKRLMTAATTMSPRVTAAMSHFLFHRAVR